MSERFEVVGGANDPEMKAIGELLAIHEVNFCFAAIDGARCNPGNSYSANSTVSANGSSTARLNGPYDKYVFVECKPGDVFKQNLATVIDHHEPGDPGYDLGPADFWKASSIGQVSGWLEGIGSPVEITQDMRVIAAMDHCRQAAIRGECPGVSKDEVIAKRVASIVEEPAVSTEDVMEMIAHYAAIFETSKPMEFGNGKVIDFRNEHLGVGYTAEFLSAQTALDINGLAGLLRNNTSPKPEDEKIMLTGHATPEMVEYFKTTYAPANGLIRVFGVPIRGYAGGHIVPHKGSML